MAIDDHGAEQQAPDDPVIQPLRQERWPDPQEAVDLVLAKAVTRHKGSACANVSVSGMLQQRLRIISLIVWHMSSPEVPLILSCPEV